MGEAKLFLEFVKWVIAAILIGGLGSSYIGYLQDKDIRHVELCEKLNCLDPRIKLPGGGK